MRKIYIIFSTTKIGGAEKRFISNWHSLILSGLDIKIILDKRLYADMSRQIEFQGKINDFKENIFLFNIGNGSYASFLKSAHSFVKDKCDHNAIIHYPLACYPFIKFSRQRIVVSWVHSSMPLFSVKKIKSWIGAWVSFLAANHVDILNPNVFNEINKITFVKKKASLTAGGTYVDPSIYKPLKKELNFVFLGRIEEEKQADRLANALPDVHRNLKLLGFHSYKFIFCGQGSGKEKLKIIIDNICNDVPCDFNFCSNPEEVLGKAAIYFSLQRTSNYPSRALAEAMCCGAYPVLTDVGESRMMIDGCPYYYFTPKEFSVSDITEAIKSYLILDEESRFEISRMVSEFSVKKFTSSIQRDYYIKIYNSL